jgi:hypothetical protein
MGVTFAEEEQKAQAFDLLLASAVWQVRSRRTRLFLVNKQQVRVRMKINLCKVQRWPI